MADALFSQVGSADQFSRVLAQATAPTFLLGAVAAFISLLITRLNRIIDRSNVLIGIADDAKNAHLKDALPHLKWRATLMNRAIEFAIISGLFTTLLVILAFVSAFLNVQHEYGAGILFAIALCFFVAALITLWREVRAALRDLDHFP
jgi:hypothetical protein